MKSSSRHWSAGPHIQHDDGSHGGGTGNIGRFQAVSSIAGCIPRNCDWKQTGPGQERPDRSIQADSGKATQANIGAHIDQNTSSTKGSAGARRSATTRQQVGRGTIADFLRQRRQQPPGDDRASEPQTGRGTADLASRQAVSAAHGSGRARDVKDDVQCGADMEGEQAQAPPQVTSSPRVTLLNCMALEWCNRLEKMEADPNTCEALPLVKHGWAIKKVDQLHWQYLAWNPEEQKPQPGATKEPVPQAHMPGQRAEKDVSGRKGAHGSSIPQYEATHRNGRERHLAIPAVSEHQGRCRSSAHAVAAVGGLRYANSHWRFRLPKSSRA